MRDYHLKTKTIHLGAIAIDSDAFLYALWKVENAIKISAIRIGVNTGCAKADTNYNTFAVKNGSTTVASIANGPNTSAGTSLTAGAFAAMTLVAAAAEVAAGDTLTLDITKTGNGLALAGAILQIEYYDYNA